MKKRPVFLLLALVCGMASCDKDDDDTITPPELNLQDKTFMVNATYGNLGEAGAGDVAVQRSSNADVRNYGNTMKTDHTSAQESLYSMASGWFITLPAETDQEHKNMQATLSGLSGAAFDSTYLYMMVEDHGKAITMYQDEIQGGENEQLKQYAGDKLPVIEHHRHLADSMAHTMFP